MSSALTRNILSKGFGSFLSAANITCNYFLPWMTSVAYANKEFIYLKCLILKRWNIFTKNRKSSKRTTKREREREKKDIGLRVDM